MRPMVELVGEPEGEALAGTEVCDPPQVKRPGIRM
jgi:hypothetical protein